MGNLTTGWHPLTQSIKVLTMWKTLQVKNYITQNFTVMCHKYVYILYAGGKTADVLSCELQRSLWLTTWKHQNTGQSRTWFDSASISIFLKVWANHKITKLPRVSFHALCLCQHSEQNVPEIEKRKEKKSINFKPKPSLVTYFASHFASGGLQMKNSDKNILFFWK